MKLDDTVFPDPSLYESPKEDDDIEEDDDIDWEEEEREAIREQEEEKKRMSTTNFSQGVFQPSSPWGTQPQGTYSPWGTSSTPSSSPWGQPYNPWAPKTTWGNTTPVWTNGNQQSQQQFVIDRTKKVVFCDLLDCLISSIDGQGRPGVAPRGIYDIYIRRDVISQISCFGPSWVVILTNQGFQHGTGEEKKFTRMVDYVCACVADLVRLPIENIWCITKATLDPSNPFCKPGLGLLRIAVSRLGPLGIKKSDMIIIGSQSGYQGQSGKDRQMAEAAGIDYLDIQQLITFYK